MKTAACMVILYMSVSNKDVMAGVMLDICRLLAYLYNAVIVFLR